MTDAIEANRLSSRDDGVNEAITEVDYAWHLFSTAKSPLDAATALTTLNDRLSDLRSWHPGYDYNTGTLPWEREVED